MAIQAAQKMSIVSRYAIAVSMADFLFSGACGAGEL